MRSRQYSLTISSSNKGFILKNLNLKHESCEQEKSEYLSYFLNNNFEYYLPEIDLKDQSFQFKVPFVDTVISTTNQPKPTIKNKIKISSKAALANPNSAEFEFIQNGKAPKQVDIKKVFTSVTDENIENFNVEDLINITKKNVDENLKKSSIFLTKIDENKNQKNNNFATLRKYFSDMNEHLKEYDNMKNYIIDHFDKISSLDIIGKGNKVKLSQ